MSFCSSVDVGRGAVAAREGSQCCIGHAAKHGTQVCLLKGHDSSQHAFCLLLVQRRNHALDLCSRRRLKNSAQRCWGEGQEGPLASVLLM